MDGPLPYLLGHYQRVHFVLRHRDLAGLLPLGLRVATSFDCRGQQTDSVWTTLEDWARFWDFDCVGSGQFGVVSVLLLDYEVEEAAGRAGVLGLIRRVERLERDEKIAIVIPLITAMSCLTNHSNIIESGESVT